MNSCATEPGRLARRERRGQRRWSRAVVALTTVLLASPVFADGHEIEEEAEEEPGLEVRAEATLGARIYIIDDPQDDDDIGGFWDQYRQTRKKNNDPPFFIDLFHTDIGLARDDDTYLIRLESWSPNAYNDHAEVDGDWRGFELDIDYRRYRSEELRFFPEGTLQEDDNPPDPFLPYGTHYTADASDDEIRNSNRRIFLRRQGIEGELRFRPEDFGLTLPVLSQVSVRSGFESRKGWRQDSFLLDNSEPAASNRRFRGNRRRVDQEVSKVGGGFLLSPTSDWVADFDVFFESFREKADVVTYQDISPIPPPTGDLARRAFNFTPNTDRFSGTMRLAGSVGPVSLQSSGFVTYLRQTNKAPLQRSQDRDKQDLVTWSAHGAFSAPLSDDLDLSGFVKYSARHNQLDENDFDTGSQIGPILRRRSELEAEVELAMRPQAGALVAAGYRFDWVDRNLRYPDPPGVIVPELALVESDSEKHNLYLRGRARVLRRGQLSGELGWEYAPQRDFPRDPSYTIYFDGRGSYTFPQPVPLTFALFGGVREGKGNGKVLTGASTQARKDLDRLEWNYGATATALPWRNASLTLSFVQQRDEQDFDYLRSDVPRTAGTAFTDFVPDPERPHYRSDVKSLGLSASQRVWDVVELRAFTNLNWVRAWYSDASTTSVALESANEIKNRIVSVGGGVGWDAMQGLRFDVGYRFDDYEDKRERNAVFSQDDQRHTFTLAATVDLGLFAGRVFSAR